MNNDRTSTVLTVSQLTAQIKAALEDRFPAVWVSGEISNLSRPHSGHVYLTLKDENAQIRAAIWRGAAGRIRFDVQDGLQVICQGEIDVYPPRGSYQLIIRAIEPLGEGALQLALRQLRARLSAEGLFDEARKRPLPRFPRRIAFVTSPTGAAIRDFLEVVRRRWRGAHVLVIPARVQGDGAAEEIVRGIQVANALIESPDVLIVGRGGGSLEDLWCFNEEIVVRAIHASRIPVVSAVGHEIDVTLSDLVADVRALTPSEAAERVVPSADEIAAGLKSAAERLTAALRSRAQSARERLDALATRRVFRRPFDVVHDLARRLDEMDLRVSRALAVQLDRSRQRTAALAGRLESLSPLAVLARGYSVTQLAASGEILRDASAVAPGDLLATRLARGQVVSTVDRVDANEENSTDNP